MKKRGYEEDNDDGDPIGLSKDEIEESLPNLSEELEEEEGKDLKVNPFDRYEPDIIDFLRRCEDDSEAKDLIGWMKDNDRIDEEKAKEIKRKLDQEGVRSFGSLKKWGWYSKKAKEMEDEDSEDEVEEYE